MNKRILFLGKSRKNSSLISSIEKKGFTVIQSSEKISWEKEFDLIICFGYRHIIKEEQIYKSSAPIINLHISYLPWNKGAHPNFWSHYESTPSGVTIHEIDPGIDTGNIIYQKYVNFKDNEDTFALTYKRLLIEIEDLFCKNIDSILYKRWNSKPQRRAGTTHKIQDLPPSFKGWDSNIQNEIARLDKILSDKIAN
tara:strand:+ start:23 stop:610 length:588 start_codon:yes stop_codon:yes gene_type:complete